MIVNDAMTHDDTTSDGTPSDTADPAAAERLFAKLRPFLNGLDPAERAAFAALVGPGIAMAYDTDDVTGFTQSWKPAHLPDGLAETIRRNDVQISGLDD